jgi:gliding motility-associated-like protein
MKLKLFNFTLVVIFTTSLFSQNCGIKNPSFESYSACPTNFSQFDRATGWYNVLIPAFSTPDYFNSSCGIIGFSATGGIVVSSDNSNSFHNCAAAGLFLNYNDGLQDPKYKEYIGQGLNLKAGVTYNLSLQIWKSNDNSTDDLARNFVIYGYNGAIPASQLDFCITGAVPLDSILTTLITPLKQTLQVTFTPTINYSNILFGPSCDGSSATQTGYVYIDRVDLTSTDDSTLNPIIEYLTIPSSNGCCYSKTKQDFLLVGNSVIAGATVTWGQSISNPETVTFVTPNDTSTIITGVGLLAPGDYEFYYSFTKGGCIVTDTLKLEVVFLPIDAGTDLIYCNGNNDNPFGTTPLLSNNKREIIMDASPDTAFLNQGNYSHWWSMIRGDGSEWTFKNPCVPYDGTDEGTVSNLGVTWVSAACGKSDRYNSPENQFNIYNAQDSIEFIWHILDMCGNELRDTVLVVMNDVDLDFTNFPTQVCPGDTVTVYQNTDDLVVGPNPHRISKLTKKPNLKPKWTASIPGVIFLDSLELDSVRLIVPSTTGTFDVTLTVTDTISGCIFFDQVSTSVVPPVGLTSAGTDYIYCSGNNDIYDTIPLRIHSMNAIPNLTTVNANGYQTWWSMIRGDGSEWIFSNPCVPYDGDDEGRVKVALALTTPSNCGNITPVITMFPASSSPTAAFIIKNAQDSIYFIWNVGSGCGEVKKDTVLVVMNDIDLVYDVAQYCAGDTVLVKQVNDVNILKLAAQANLKYSWTSLNGSFVFLDQTKSDSSRVIINNAVNDDKIVVTITDTITGCTWFDDFKLNIEVPITSVYAGPSITTCVATNSYFLTMDASPTIEANPPPYCSWWSVIPQGKPEWVFPPATFNCTILGDGINQGDVFSFGSANRSNAQFMISTYGYYKFIWHVYSECQDSIYTDTMNFNWGYDEPTVNGGGNLTPTCNVTELLGNISGASAGNTGGYAWNQIAGPGALNIVNSTNNVAYVLGLDTTTPGVYQIEYALGYEPCIKRDTILLTVNLELTNAVVPITSTWDGISNLCLGDSVEVTASGFYEYAFIKDGVVVQPFSIDSTYKVQLNNDTSRVTLLVRDVSMTCMASADSVLVFTPTYCTTIDTIYTLKDTCVSTSEMPFGWDRLIPCSSLTTSIGASFTIADTCITYTPIAVWQTDTLCVILQDTTNGVNDTTIIIIMNNDSTFNIYCNDTTIFIDSNGLFTIDTSFVLDSIVTYSGVDSAWLSKTTITCGTTDSVMVYARSGFGIIDSCKAYIIIQDTIKPSVVCMDTTIYLNASGNFTIDTSFVLSSYYENCTVSSITLNKSVFTCADFGVNQVKIIIQDNSGYKDSCTAQVTVSDTTAPIITCKNATVYLDNTGQVTLSLFQLLTNVNDNCSVNNLWMSQTNLTCLDDTVKVKLYANDFSGNIDSCESQVIVLDTLNPIITCKDSSIYIGISGTVIIDTSYVLTNVSDNCALDSVWLSETNLSCINDTIQITTYALDINGNIDSCTSQIILIDTLKPIVSCHDTTLYIDSTGTAKINVADITISITDQCGLDSVWLSDTLANCTNDTLYVTIYAKDNSGNMDSCISRVIILDTTISQVICKNALAYLDASANVTIDSNYTDSASFSSCGIDSMYIIPNSFNCSNTGVNNVKLYVRSINGKIDSCSSVLTVLDTIKPQLSCKDTTLYLAGGTISIDSSFVTSLITDNCGIGSVTLSKTNFTCTDLDTNRVTVIVTDLSGNIDSCVANVIMLDTLKPIVSCKDTVVYLSALGAVTIDSSFVDNGTSDNCSFITVLSKSTFTCNDIGLDTIWYYATDPSGNQDSCRSVVTVLDTINPVAICQSITVAIASNGIATVNPLLVNNGSSDNCPLSYAVGKPTYTCADTGTFSDWLYVTDSSGNVDSCSFSVTIIDQTPPSPTCIDIIVYLDANGSVTIDTNDIDGASTDNCSIINRSLSKTTFTCADIGNNVVKLYLTDPSGNIDSCSANVSVIDSINPTINCPNDIVLTVSDINCSYIMPDFSNQLTLGDNCGTSTLTVNQNPSPGTEITVNSNVTPITITVTDVSLNTSICSYDLTLNCVKEFDIPNVFSPNNDGQNETFAIPQLAAYPDNTIKIYNRWGTLVYEEKGYLDGWKGTNQAGKKLSPSTYYYIIILGVDDIEDKKGHIQLFE